MSDIQLKVGRFYQDGNGNVSKIVDKYTDASNNIIYKDSDGHEYFSNGIYECYPADEYNLVRELPESDWIIHDSIAQPVDSNTLVQVLLRNGEYKQREAQYFDWDVVDYPHCIMAYLIIKEEEKPVEVKEEIKVGDYVQDKYGTEAEIIGVHRDMAWLYYSCTNTYNARLIDSLSKVKTITKAEAEAKLGCKIVGE